MVLLLALTVGLGLIATSLGTVFPYENRPLKLFLIDAGYQAVWLAAA
jgi:hypothetical protein